MNTNQRRMTLSLGAMAVGWLAAAFLPMAVAVADEFDLTPDISTFNATGPVEGLPGLFTQVTGTEVWGVTDLTTNVPTVTGLFAGDDTATTIGSFTSNDFFGSTGAFGSQNFSLVGNGLQIDLANYGSGFENELVDLPSNAPFAPGVSDLLITPFGDFSLLGSLFTDFSSAF